MTQTNTFASRITSVAMLAMAALPIAALSTAAHAATVKVSDLNLTTSQGVAAFHQRADLAAQAFCANERGIDARQNCRQGVAVELGEKMEAARNAQLAAQASHTFAAR